MSKYLKTCSPSQVAQDKLQSDKEAYDAGVMDYEAWLHQAQMDNANDPVLGLDPEHLEKELKDNQVRGRCRIHKSV